MPIDADTIKLPIAVDTHSVAGVETAIERKKHATILTIGSASDIIDLIIFKPYVPLLTPDLAGQTYFPEPITSSLVSQGLIIPAKADDRNEIGKIRDQAYSLTPNMIQLISNLTKPNKLMTLDLETIRSSIEEHLARPHNKQGWLERSGDNRYRDVYSELPNDLHLRLGLQERDHAIWLADVLSRAFYYQDSAAILGYQYNASKIRALALTTLNEHKHFYKYNFPSVGATIISLFDHIEVGPDWHQYFAMFLSRLRDAVKDIPPPEYYTSGQIISERKKNSIDRAYALELASKIGSLRFTSLGSLVFGSIAGTIASIISQNLASGIITGSFATATSFVRDKEAIFITVKGMKFLRVLHHIATPKLVTIKPK
ncbi:hypothetical protein ACFLUZ_04280 [Chloroflexota bacterium]